MSPRVCVIIACYNGRQYLPDCLSSLVAVDYPKDGREILVVDNASSDGSAEYVRKNWLQVKLVVLDRNTGFTGANNVGLRYALERNCEYAFLLNQDTVVTSAFLREAVAVAQTDEKIGAVQSKLLRHNTDKINSWGNVIHFLGFGYAGGNGLPDRSMESREIAYASGAAVLLRCSALQAVGTFDETLFMYHDDLDLGWRLRLAGFHSVLAPTSVVYHKYEFSRSIRKYYLMEKNRYQIILTHYRLGTLLLLWPASLLVDLGLLAQSVAGGFFKQQVAAQLHFCRISTWRWVWSRRREVQRLRKRTDREITRLFSGRIEFQDSPLPVLVQVANAVLSGYWRMVRWLLWW